MEEKCVATLKNRLEKCSDFVKDRLEKCVIIHLCNERFLKIW